jgi:hypothetical protein
LQEPEQQNNNAKIVENLFTLLYMIAGKAVPLQHVKKKRKYKLLAKA